MQQDFGLDKNNGCGSSSAFPHTLNYPFDATSMKSLLRICQPNHIMLKNLGLTDDKMIVLLEDGRELAIPLEWFPRLS